MNETDRTNRTDGTNKINGNDEFLIEDCKLGISRIDGSTFLRIDWSGDIGWGELDFFMKDGKIVCENEGLSRDQIKKIMNAFIDDECVLEDEG